MNRAIFGYIPDNWSAGQKDDFARIETSDDPKKQDLGIKPGGVERFLYRSWDMEPSIVVLEIHFSVSFGIVLSFSLYSRSSCTSFCLLRYPVTLWPGLSSYQYTIPLWSHQIQSIGFERWISCFSIDLDGFQDGTMVFCAWDYKNVFILQPQWG